MRTSKVTCTLRRGLKRRPRSAKGSRKGCSELLSIPEPSGGGGSLLEWKPMLWPQFQPSPDCDRPCGSNCASFTSGWAFCTTLSLPCVYGQGISRIPNLRSSAINESSTGDSTTSYLSEDLWIYDILCYNICPFYFNILKFSFSYLDCWLNLKII